MMNDYPTLDLTAYLAEYTDDGPRVKAGTIVEYHGSITWAHGAYIVIDPPTPGHAATPGSYALAPFEGEHSGEIPGEMLFNVRRKSFTVVVLPE